MPFQKCELLGNIPHAADFIQMIVVAIRNFYGCRVDFVNVLFSLSMHYLIFRPV